MALDRSLRKVKEIVFLPGCRLIAGIVTPMQVTIIGFIFGLLSPLCLCQQYYALGMIFWIINRILDGVDGTIARVTNTQSDLGGYVDIVCDFIVYALIPIGLVYANPSPFSYLIVSLLEATFFVNAASLMVLSSILEKRALGSKVQGEMTTVTMPTGLIEGTETIVFMSLSILFPSYIDTLHILFGLGVIVNIIYRVYWASNNID